MEAILAKLGLWLWSQILDLLDALGILFPSLVGSGLSVFLAAEKIPKLTPLTKLFTFIFGVIIGHQVGGAAIEYWQISPLSLTASSIQIGVGFIGMACLAEAKIQLPVWIGAMRKKLLGE